MHNKKRGIEAFFSFIIILLPLLMIPTIVFGGESDRKPERNSERQPDYILIVKEGLVALKAKDASFKEILEDIGRRMNIEVIVNIPKEEKITVEFDMMYLGDAIKRFKTSYAYITNTEKERGRITKIVVVPKGTGKVQSNKFEYNPQPSIQREEPSSREPFEFEYNPQPTIKKKRYEVKEQKRLVGPEIGERRRVEAGEGSRPAPLRFEHEPEGFIKKDEVGEPSRPAPFKFDYDPQPSVREEK